MNKHGLNDIELRIMYYLYHSGPAFVKKLALRLKKDIQSINVTVRSLQDMGYLKRVTKTLVDYRIGRRNKVIKHRNHTYYELTRKGRLFMRQFHGNINVNLRPPYKQV